MRDDHFLSERKPETEAPSVHESGQHIGGRHRAQQNLSENGVAIDSMLRIRRRRRAADCGHPGRSPGQVKSGTQMFNGRNREQPWNNASRLSYFNNTPPEIEKGIPAVTRAIRQVCG
jgi:hypothetical protein